MINCTYSVFMYILKQKKFSNKYKKPDFITKRRIEFKYPHRRKCDDSTFMNRPIHTFVIQPIWRHVSKVKLVKECKQHGDVKELHGCQMNSTEYWHCLCIITWILVLVLLLTKLLRAIKKSLQRYCSTAYSRSGVNQMWILKNSKELLENLKSHDFSKIDSIKTYDFSRLYTTIPHNRLKSRLFQIINNCFFKTKMAPGTINF
jgi:hypothetical protein